MLGHLWAFLPAVFMTLWAVLHGLLPHFLERPFGVLTGSAGTAVGMVCVVSF